MIKSTNHDNKIWMKFDNINGKNETTISNCSGKNLHEPQEVITTQIQKLETITKYYGGKDLIPTDGDEEEEE